MVFSFLSCRRRVRRSSPRDVPCEPYSLRKERSTSTEEVDFVAARRGLTAADEARDGGGGEDQEQEAAGVDGVGDLPGPEVGAIDVGLVEPEGDAGFLEL